VNAVVLSGGSAFGLDAAQGRREVPRRKTYRLQDQRGCGPDRSRGDASSTLASAGNKTRPTADCGYKAAGAATDGRVCGRECRRRPPAQTVGKIGGGRNPMKAGLGSAAITLPNGLIVGAIVAVNSVVATSSILQPDRRRRRARRGREARRCAQSASRRRADDGAPARRAHHDRNRSDEREADESAGQPHGTEWPTMGWQRRAVSVAQRLVTGDTVFALATGGWNGTADVTTVGALAADVLSEAIVRARR